MWLVFSLYTDACVTQETSEAAHYYFVFLSFFSFFFISLFLHFPEILLLGYFFRQASFLVPKNKSLANMWVGAGSGGGGYGGGGG